MYQRMTTYFKVAALPAQVLTDRRLDAGIVGALRICDSPEP